jgi:hypothetical protein
MLKKRADQRHRCKSSNLPGVDKEFMRWKMALRRPFSHPRPQQRFHFLARS